MNERLKELMLQAGYAAPEIALKAQELARLLIKDCTNTCSEMAAKCAGLPGDGALATDCVNQIKEDFGVK